MALRAAHAASSKKAERIVILDVSQLLVITDLFVICSARNDRQVRTVAEEVERRLQEEFGSKPFRREGEQERRWVLLDYVDFVVHVFHQEERDYYDLERLWGDAPVVPFDEDDGAAHAREPGPTWEEDDGAAAAQAT